MGGYAPNPLELHDLHSNVFEVGTGKVPSDKGSSLLHARGGSWVYSRTPQSSGVPHA